ncbi:MAG: ABC transporter substrate-binding protein [Betaproteobacteria bacterium RIFCSPLOWO2_02_FULL_67_26]|nr:MAG: ABC transporter substrate-binding protein [Betaproteobacteria bacterium RIFCSPLOWO2_02_FULL_67_26]
MVKILEIAARNLLRYRRRTLLTSLLVVIGIAAVLLFVAITGSFKALMIGQITDSMLGHLQVHRRGYVASIESLPLNLNMPPQLAAQAVKALDGNPDVEAYAPRIKFGAMFSNFTETTSVRVNGVDPGRENSVTPLLAGRQLDGERGGALVKRGEMLVPVLVARGLQVKAGDTVVLVTTNKDGSVNGKTFVVRGTLESATGPGGRDGYVHIEDARELLRMTEPEVTEFAVRVKRQERVERVTAALVDELAAVKNKQGAAALEVHSWQRLTPFANIANMIDVLTLAIKVMLVSIVLVAIMNVMVMAVYERIREIGTIAAIGTPPRRILALFLTEGLLLGVLGSVIGTGISLGGIYALNVWKISYNFGQQQGLLLAPAIGVQDVLSIAGMVIVVAVLASLQPAWKASRMDPITALRHV